MNDFIKTELGIEVLQRRNIFLSAKQRRLLVLIGSKDFEIMPPLIKLKIAAQETLDQLLEMGMISKRADANNGLINESQKTYQHFQAIVY